jgi:pyruvate kinase
VLSQSLLPHRCLEPTRAEVSDVSTAAVLGSDCVMLSDETASGKYPIQSVKMMKKIVMYAEKNSPVEAVFKKSELEHLSKQDAVCNAVTKLADDVHATAIVAETKSGATAIQLASRRPKNPVIAVTSQDLVANQLALVYGVKSYIRPDHKYAASKLTDWLLKHNVLKKGDVVVTASGKYPGVVGTTDTVKIRVIGDK